jgi:hypothetical protein
MITSMSNEAQNMSSFEISAQYAAVSHLTINNTVFLLPVTES